MRALKVIVSVLIALGVALLTLISFVSAASPLRQELGGTGTSTLFDSGTILYQTNGSYNAINDFTYSSNSLFFTPSTTITSSYNAYTLGLTVKPSVTSSATYSGLNYAITNQGSGGNITGVLYGINGLVSLLEAGKTTNASVGALFASGILDGTATTLSGFDSSILASGGTTTNAYGGRILAFTGGGVVTNGISLFSESPSVGLNQWNIYASGTARSYFGGNVGIGTTTPNDKLTISGGGVTFTSGTAVTAGNYQITRDADATNQLHFNVPTGAGMEWSINDVANIKMSSAGDVGIGANATALAKVYITKNLGNTNSYGTLSQIYVQNTAASNASYRSIIGYLSTENALDDLTGTLAGFEGQVAIVNNSLVSSAYGVYGLVSVGLPGFGSTPNATTVAGVAGIIDTAEGTATNAISLWAQPFSTLTGTVTNAYGLKVDPPGHGTNQWTAAIGSGNSYLSGNTIFGASTTPGYTVDVRGTFGVFGSSTLSTTTLAYITGSTQCLHVDTNGVITGTGADCGAGGASGIGTSTANYMTFYNSATTVTGTSFAQVSSTGIIFTPTTTFTSGITFTGDNANLYRSAADTVKTNGTFASGGVTLFSTPVIRAITTSGALALQGNLSNVANVAAIQLSNVGARTPASGVNYGTTAIGSFSSTNNVAEYNEFALLPTINQTGTASGTTRAFYINPTFSGTIHKFVPMELAAKTVPLVSNTVTSSYQLLGNQYTYSVVSGTSTYANAYGISWAIPSGSSSTTITNSYGIHVRSSTLAGVTNGYGLFVAAPTGATNNYGAYIDGIFQVSRTSTLASTTIAGRTSISSYLYGTNTGATAYNNSISSFVASQANDTDNFIGQNSIIRLSNASGAADNITVSGLYGSYTAAEIYENRTSTSMAGSYSELLITNSGHTDNGIVVAANYFVEGSGTSSASSLALFGNLGPTDVSAGNVTEAYGLHLFQIDGATENWGIGVDLSNNYMSGSLSLGTSDVPTYTLNLVGTSLFSIPDNTAFEGAFHIGQSTDNYFDVSTLDGEEKIIFGNSNTNPDTTFQGSGPVTVQGSFFVLATSSLSTTTVSSQFFLPGIVGPTSTDDIVCWHAGSGSISHQATNCTVSSIRFKHNVVPIKTSLDKILALKPVEYDRKSDNKHEYGLIAEEVQKVDPNLVIFEADGKTPRSVKYEQFITTLSVKAIQEQQKQIDTLTARLNELENKSPQTSIANWKRIISWFNNLF